MTEIIGLNDFFERWLGELGWDAKEKNYLFRGVPSKNYDIGEASAYRRLEKESIFPRFSDPTNNSKKNLPNLIKINRDLIDEARFRRYDQKYGRTLSDLEILGELQHFRAATCLIDFTFHPGIALWFACQPSSEEGEDGTYGKVAAVRNDERIKHIRPEWQLAKEKKFEDFFKADVNGKYPIYCWQPDGITSRVEHQEGAFLFSGSKIEPEAECYIHEVNKMYFLPALFSIDNIYEETLFPDFDGFAHRNAHDVPYNLSPMDIGYKAFRRGHYAKAISNFTEALRQYDEDNSIMSLQVRLIRGNAHFQLKQYTEAIEDFEEVMSREKTEMDPGIFYADACWRRGCVKAEMGQHKEAKEDLQMALKVAQKKNHKALITKIQKDLAKLES